MAKVKKELADILQRFDIDPREALWDCHGTLVIYHKFCEIIAAKAGIQWELPVALEANSREKCVALCVAGRMGDRVEWATGEAAPGNNKNSYPYAMAEKRAKDRVILKLVGLSGFIYSEDEADEFKDSPKGKVEVDTAPANDKGAPKGAAMTEAQQKWLEARYAELNNPKHNTISLEEWHKKHRDGIQKLHDAFPAEAVLLIDTYNNLWKKVPSHAA